MIAQFLHYIYIYIYMDTKVSRIMSKKKDCCTLLDI